MAIKIENTQKSMDYDYPNYSIELGSNLSIESNDDSDLQCVDVSSGKDQGPSGAIVHYCNNLAYLSGQESHAFVIGDSGTGKTRRVVYPSILLSSKSKDSMVITDPKGEIYRHTSKELEKRGYDVKVINLRMPSRGDWWNPFSIIERLWDAEQRDQIGIMLGDIFSIILASVHSENDIYWENSAKSVLMGTSYLLLEKHIGQNRLTFKNISQLANEIMTICSMEYSGNQYDGKEDISINFPNAIDGVIKAGLSPVLGNSEKTIEGIRSVMNTALSPFVLNEGLSCMLSSSSLEIDMIGRNSTALFIVIPDDNEELYSVATLLIKQIYTELIMQADSSATGKLEKSVLFFLDEFANFSRIPSIHSMLTAARSRGIRFILVCQSSEQLDMKYGSLEADVIRSNCRVWIYLGTRSYRMLSLLMDLAGYTINPITMTRIPILDIQRLQKMKKGEAVIFNDRSSPFISNLPDIDEYSFEKPIEKSINLNDIPIRKDDFKVFNALELLEKIVSDWKQIRNI